MKNLVKAFVDTETTGLNLSTTEHEVIEYSILIERNGSIVDRITRKVKPSRIELAHPRALEINGYTEEKWADALTKKQASEEIERLLCGKRGLVVVGHNVSFDRTGLNALLEEAESEERITHRVFDTQALVYEHLFDIGLKSTSFDNVRKWFGWSKANAHTAEKDVGDCFRLFHTLYQAGRLKKIWWKITCPRRMK